MDEQRIEAMIETAIERAMDNLEVKVRFDGDGDIEVSLTHNGEIISTDYVDIDCVFNQQENNL